MNENVICPKQFLKSVEKENNTFHFISNKRPKIIIPEDMKKTIVYKNQTEARGLWFRVGYTLITIWAKPNPILKNWGFESGSRFSPNKVFHFFFNFFFKVNKLNLLNLLRTLRPRRKPRLRWMLKHQRKQVIKLFLGSRLVQFQWDMFVCEFVLFVCLYFVVEFV